MPVRDHTDVTFNLAGLWLVQAFLGITQLPPELRALPYGEPPNREWLSRHPGMAILAKEGICDKEGTVRSDLAERMEVLALPDVEVVVLASRGKLEWSQPVLGDPATWRSLPAEQLRIVLARRDERWVSAARAGDNIVIDDCAAGGDEWLARLVCDTLETVHEVEPAKFDPVNLPLDELQAVATGRARETTVGAKDAILRRLGLRGAALVQLGAALDNPLAEAVLYARAHNDLGAISGESVLDLRDTESGRIAMYKLARQRGSNRDWMSFGPATLSHARRGVNAVLASVPVRSWPDHRRA